LYARSEGSPSERILEGYGYELTPTDVIDAYQRLMAAAQKLDIAVYARNDVLARSTGVWGKGNRRRTTDMDKKKHHEALSRKPISQKLVAGLQRHRVSKAVSLADVINSSAAAEELQRGMAGGLTGFHPAHAAYVYTQNQVSVMSEHLTALKKVAPFAEVISKAEELYIPSAPPIEPAHDFLLHLLGLLRCLRRSGERDNRDNRP
jgi:hypothetical protein